jgi:hypothetical protein
MSGTFSSLGELAELLSYLVLAPNCLWCVSHRTLSPVFWVIDTKTYDGHGLGKCDVSAKYSMKVQNRALKYSERRPGCYSATL